MSSESHQRMSLVQRELLKRRRSGTLTPNTRVMVSRAPVGSQLPNIANTEQPETTPAIVATRSTPHLSSPNSSASPNQKETSTTRKLRSPIMQEYLNNRSTSTSMAFPSSQSASVLPRQPSRPPSASVSSFSGISSSPVRPVRRPSLSPAAKGYTLPQGSDYSARFRRRKALLIAISYQDHRFLHTLPGSTNDLRAMFSLLIGPMFQFPRDGIRVLCDELDTLGGLPVFSPTRINILEGLTWLTHGISDGDSAFFYFAGHGDAVEDRSGDEVETGFDQCIMPVDYAVAPLYAAGPLPRGVPAILDDVIYERLVCRVPKGAKVTAVFDACRSGTVCDLPVQYDELGRVRFRNGERRLPRDARRPTQSAGGFVQFSSSADHQMSAEMVVDVVYYSRELSDTMTALSVQGPDQLPEVPKQAAGPDLCGVHTNSKHTDETHPPDSVGQEFEMGALNAASERKYFGIMTRSFVDALLEMSSQRTPHYAGVENWTYGKLLHRIRELVRERTILALPEYIERQQPQLSTSHPIDIWEKKFSM